MALAPDSRTGPSLGPWARLGEAAAEGSSSIIRRPAEPSAPRHGVPPGHPRLWHPAPPDGIAYK